MLLEFAPFCSTIFNMLMCLNFPPFIWKNIIHKRKQKTPRYGQYYWWKNNNIITYIFWLPDSHFLLHHYSQKVDIGLIVNMLVSVETQPMASWGCLEWSECEASHHDPWTLILSSEGGLCADVRYCSGGWNDKFLNICSTKIPYRVTENFKRCMNTKFSFVWNFQ